jgi:hypothetical protein
VRTHPGGWRGRAVQPTVRNGADTRQGKGLEGTWLKLKNYLPLESCKLSGERPGPGLQQMNGEQSPEKGTPPSAKVQASSPPSDP